MLFKHWQPYNNTIIGTATDDESDESDVEEEAAHRLPPELAELFRSDTEDEDFIGFSDLEWHWWFGKLVSMFFML